MLLIAFYLPQAAHNITWWCLTVNFCGNSNSNRLNRCQAFLRNEIYTMTTLLVFNTVWNGIDITGGKWRARWWQKSQWKFIPYFNIYLTNEEIDWRRKSAFVRNRHNIFSKDSLHRNWIRLISYKWFSWVDVYITP